MAPSVDSFESKRSKLRNTHKARKGQQNGTFFNEESYRIMGACFEVCKDKGNGFLEAVYQECLRIELSLQGIAFVEKPRLRLEYKGTSVEQEYEPNYLCFDQILLEIKAVKHLPAEHRAQVINYLKATGKQLASLVNFGHDPKLEYEGFVNQPFSHTSRVS